MRGRSTQTGPQLVLIVTLLTLLVMILAMRRRCADAVTGFMRSLDQPASKDPAAPPPSRRATPPPER